MNGFSYSEIEAFVSKFYVDQNGMPRRLQITPYGYPITFSSLAQGASSTATLNISANADFVLLGLHYRANIGAAQTVSNKTAAFIRMLITDAGTGENFTNSAVDLENYCTNGHYDNGLPYPRILTGKSSLTIQLTSYAPTAETYAVDLYLEGVQVRAY